MKRIDLLILFSVTSLANTYAQGIERTVRPFIDPALELKMMTIVPICNPYAYITKGSNDRMKCSAIPSKNECPTGQYNIGMDGRMPICRTLAFVPPPSPKNTSNNSNNRDDKLSNVRGKNGEVYSSAKEANNYGGGVKNYNVNKSVTSVKEKSVQGGSSHGKSTSGNKKK